jgi:hypothetical protein
VTTIDVQNLKSLRRATWRGRGRTIPFAGRIVRVLSLLLLLLLGTIVGLYVRLTNPDRVRAMAISFLSRGIEGNVQIGHARLSLFEGLQLRDVSISTKSTKSDATVFSTPLLEIQFSPSTLFTGEINSARVIATEPEVFLVEDVDRGRWSFEDLKREGPPGPSTQGDQSFRAPKLPEILIRSGRMHRGQIVGGKFEPLATMRLEGQLLPRGGDYHFNLQTRTDDGRAGPALQGEFELATSVARSSLTNVNLDFLESVLPAQVRRFWTRLSPTGRVDVPVLSTLRDAQGKLGFQIELELNDVYMVVRPLDWTFQRDERFALEHSEALCTHLLSLPGTSLLRAAVAVQPRLRAGEVPLSNVQGRFVFTDQGVTLDRLNASIDGNRFLIHGALAGYDVEKMPMSLQLESPAARPIELQSHVPYINSLPAEIREVYYRFRPQGRSKVMVRMQRDAPGQRIRVGGFLEFANAQFLFQEFPYPVYGASGRLVIDNDPAVNEPRLVIDHVRGHGAMSGPNATGELGVSGVITPLIGYSSVDIAVSGKGITSEPSLIAAIPREARSIISEFDDDGDGPNPRFDGDFTCRVHREPGPVSRWTYDTDVSIRNGFGSFKGFPYPLEDFSAELQIRKDYVRIVSAESKHDGGTLEITGLSEWGNRVNPNRKVGEPSTRTTLLLVAKNAPVDESLLRALPPEAREPLERFGIKGRFDITGPIAVNDPRKPPDFQLAINARDASFAPAWWKTSLERVEASLLLLPHSLKIDRASGRRDESPVTASGKIDWSETPSLSIEVRADQLELDDAIRGSLAPEGQTIWDSLRPKGAVDLLLKVNGPATKPAWTAQISPSGASLRPNFFLMDMTSITGTIVASPDRIELQNLEATVAGGRAKVSGVGEFANRSVWTLNIQSTDTLIDAAFHNALPDALKKILVENALTGRANLSLDQLAWTRSEDNAAIDIIFDSKFELLGMNWTVGLPFTDAKGEGTLKGHFIDDDAADLNGSLDLKSFSVGGFAARDGHAMLVTDPGTRIIRLRDIRAQVGEGDIAGGIMLDRSRGDITKWSAEVLLRNADVAKLTEGTSGLVNGQLNASLAVEGAFSSDGSRVGPRRGRGDISVTGDKLLKVPMMVGVTQIVSLSLPFTSGFNEATASYSIDDQRITFADIALKSSEMRIKGVGWLDLGQRNVSLDFYTASGGKRLPVIGSLLDAARKELFQIKVRGKLSEPQVSAGSFQTITTTVDEIMGTEKR